MQRSILQLKAFFGFTTREVNGFIVLSCIMFIFLLIPPCLDLAIGKSVNEEVKAISTNKTSFSHKVFDPNTATQLELENMGFSLKIAQRILSFRKNHPFQERADLFKIYGIDSAHVKSLLPYISISKSQQEVRREIKTNEPNFVTQSKKIERLNINDCDSAQLEALRGIGAVLASRIIRYREKLGGFVDTSQFAEVYGLKDFALNELKEKTFIQSDFIPTYIFVNQCTYDQLSRHPYIGWKAARIWENYRKQHGNFQSISDLSACKGLEGLKWEKLNRYLKF